jgi:acyl-CoA reductase-like NAD-dependent aldehyde dehydrogenase
MHTSEVFIGGQWRPPASGETYATINPATEEVSAQVAKGDERDVDLAVQAARRAFDQGPWPGWRRPSGRACCGSSPI